MKLTVRYEYRGVLKYLEHSSMAYQPGLPRKNEGVKINGEAFFVESVEHELKLAKSVHEPSEHKVTIQLAGA